MSYIDKSLGDGETVIARARFSWIYNFSAWCQFLIPAIVLVGLLAWSHGQPNFLVMSSPLTWAAILVAIWLILGFIGFLRMMIVKWTTEIGVTSHRFVEKYSVLSMRTNEIALPNIESVKLNQSLFGRIFGYGTVRIEGNGIDAVTTPSIADPVGFVRAIQTAKEHVAQRFAQQRTVAP